MARKRKYKTGKFRPLNPEKYKGDPTNIVWRSQWEFKVMAEFDKNPAILEWSSEEVIIPYKSPLDNRVHRYFPDFLIKKKNKDGKIETVLIEVKPYKETIPPKVQTTKRAKPTKQYLREVTTWGINSAKFEAANKYCRQRGWTFMILTEREIFGD